MKDYIPGERKAALTLALLACIFTLAAQLGGCRAPGEAHAASLPNLIDRINRMDRIPTETNLPPLPPIQAGDGLTEQENPVNPVNPVYSLSWSNGVVLINPPGFTWIVPGTARYTKLVFCEIKTHMRVAPYYDHDREVYGESLAIGPGLTVETGHDGHYMRKK